MTQIFWFKPFFFQVVFVAFCADWCPFSRRLKPVWEEAATKWIQDKPGTSVVWAIVDSVQQADVADKFFVNKYPTMKIFINGELINKEYRSTRSVESLIQFVDEQLKTAIVEFSSNDALHAQMDQDKRNILGYFANKNGPEYNNFQKIAALLREDCVFWLGTDEALKALNGNMLIFKDPGTGDDQTVSLFIMCF